MTMDLALCESYKVTYSTSMSRSGGLGDLDQPSKLQDCTNMYVLIVKRRAVEHKAARLRQWTSDKTADP